ncbi:peptide-methionine (S)-S-oxide reductase MsrA [Pollutimonas harenae]|uniref:Peptide methionine sulfoxide reductase MsrA n=1 Tax=Pollutimonas harenae TaxID=657015 RepID=A0A853GY10_9BURK|nr:peptide-methionine (S)-S-oxide reductase MsrA [Pollutimonas harenae]NYT87007.1 peptide-methionine (S)-S-oxide reductase MsrA [Pollutimonas harenae]TEA69306.1 peptide-methionine (S)-S-oxide reductase [Pollutimonas harenae]
MTETAILGGGCFWCTESVFLSLRGVISVTPGYSGGHIENPSYEQVCSKTTGHVEVVRLVFDPDVVDFETILQVFFATHDPTTLDRQGGDIGPQYASVIFYQSAQQHDTAQHLVAQIQQELGVSVVTHLLPAQKFWPAESYHHNYYALNPGQGYCQVVISPKLAKFRKRFAQLLIE